ncbi:MAG: AIR synthase family protein [Nitrososphaerales archaeon]
MPSYGKEYFQKIVSSKLGSDKWKSSLEVGPGLGLDNAVIKLGNRFLIVKTDPISWIPKLGAKDSAWLSIQQLVSDFVTSGSLPKYAFFEFNLPPSVKEQEFKIYWNTMDEEMKKLGITVAGGHTGKYEGCDYTVVGGATLLGFSKKYLSPDKAQVGDLIVVTKGAAIETTGILAKIFPKTISKKLGKSVLSKAQKYFDQISIVNDALIGAKFASSMHDVEEGGVISAIYEVALASGNGFSISKEDIPLSRETKEICKLFGIKNPYSSIGGGSLILTVDSRSAKMLMEAFARSRINASIVGRIEPRSYGFKVSNQKINYPIVDPYWNAYWRAVRAKWQ